MRCQSWVDRLAADGCGRLVDGRAAPALDADVALVAEEQLEHRAGRVAHVGFELPDAAEQGAREDAAVVEDDCLDHRRRVSAPPRPPSPRHEPAVCCVPVVGPHLQQTERGVGSGVGGLGWGDRDGERAGRGGEREALGFVGRDEHGHADGAGRARPRRRRRDRPRSPAPRARPSASARRLRRRSGDRTSRRCRPDRRARLHAALDDHAHRAPPDRHRAVASVATVRGEVPVRDGRALQQRDRDHLPDRVARSGSPRPAPGSRRGRGGR